MSPRGGWLIHGGHLLDAARAGRRAAGAPAAGARGAAAGAGARGVAGATARGAARAEAVVVRGDVIEAVGPLAELRRRAGRDIESFDLHGGTLTPGFVDAHIHLITWIWALREARFERGQTVEELERVVGARENRGLRPGEWITVRGWVPREWPAALLRRPTLDRISPARPLVLYAADGHSVWANGAALQAVGVTEHTPDPTGGVIGREASGALTGHLVEEAANLLRPHVPRLDDPRDELEDAVAGARALGLTSAHDFDRSATWRAAQDLDGAGRLGFRLLLSVPVASLDAAEGLGLRTGFGSGLLRVGPVKMFADGTLGSATALLEEPYEGGGLSRGIEVTPAADLARHCRRAVEAGLSVAIHAIGDRAVRHALDAIEAARAGGSRFPRPPRVEHIQLVREEDLPRFRALGTLASVQPAHLLTDRDVARRYWGVRAERSYAYRSLLKAGARLLLGSDAPFDRAGPVLALQAALHRREPGEDAHHGYYPEQRLTLSQALRAHCEDPHRAAGCGVPLGRIAPGHGADLVAFSHDLAEALRHGLTPADATALRPRATWVAGDVAVHTR